MNDGCLIRIRDYLLFASTWVHLRFLNGVRVVYLLSFLCCGVWFILFVFVLCLVGPMLPVSLHCLFVIAPSVFSSVYLP